MTKEQAARIAKEMNAERPAVSWRSARQDWRTGGHWYVRGSDGSGVFLSAATPPPCGLAPASSEGDRE